MWRAVNELDNQQIISLPTPHSNLFCSVLFVKSHYLCYFMLGGVDAAPVEIALGVSESTVSLSGVTVSSPVPETTVGLTEKAKKARKRRGTFENDKVVTASKQPPLPANGAIVEITLEE